MGRGTTEKCVHVGRERGYVGLEFELNYGGRIFCFTDAKGRRKKEGGWEILVRKKVFFIFGNVCVGREKG
jgi:hypothetical protein